MLATMIEGTALQYLGNCICERGRSTIAGKVLGCHSVKYIKYRSQKMLFGFPAQSLKKI